jgi:Ca2+/H+ antiporter
MLSKMETNREQVSSGILFILGSILFTIAAAVQGQSTEEDQGSIQQKGKIDSASILAVAYWVFLIGSVIFFYTAYQRLQQDKKQIESDGGDVPLEADKWAYAGSLILLISIVVLIISSQIRLEGAMRNDQ